MTFSDVRSSRVYHGALNVTRFNLYIFFIHAAAQNQRRVAEEQFNFSSLPPPFQSMSDDDRSNPEVEALFEDDPGEGLVGDEDDDLKLDNADTKVWLVKVNDWAT